MRHFSKPIIVAAAAAVAFTLAMSVVVAVVLLARLPAGDDVLVPGKPYPFAGLTLTVTGVAVEHPMVNGLWKTPNPEACFVVRLHLHNRTDDRKVECSPFSPFGFGGTSAELTDDIGNHYKGVSAGLLTTFAGQASGPDTFYPGDGRDDLLAFEPPVGKAKYLTLQLKSGDDTPPLRLRIPRSMWVK